MLHLNDKQHSRIKCQYNVCPIIFYWNYYTFVLIPNIVNQNKSQSLARILKDIIKSFSFLIHNGTIYQEPICKKCKVPVQILNCNNVLSLQCVQKFIISFILSKQIFQCIDWLKGKIFFLRALFPIYFRWLSLYQSSIFTKITHD